jgi:hypothetical protein
MIFVEATDPRATGRHPRPLDSSTRFGCCVNKISVQGSVIVTAHGAALSLSGANLQLAEAVCRSESDA